MRIKNTTNIPTEQIEEMINFVRPKKIGKVSFTIQNTSRGHFSGHTNTFNKVIVRINTNGKYPIMHDVRGKPEVRNIAHMKDGKMVWKEYVVRSNGGYLPSLILSKEEALVQILAHELRHIWQTWHPTKRNKVWGARGQHSERDADAYGIRKMREWRKKQRELLK